MRIAILTNILSPYRIPVYQELARLAGDLKVFISGYEDNRTWQIEENKEFEVKKTKGFVIKLWSKRFGFRRFDQKYLHIPLGTLWDLYKFNPDAVISSEMGVRTLLAWFYCVLSGKALAVQWEGTIHTEKKIFALKNIFRRRFLAKFIPAWVSYGSTSTEYLISLGVPTKRIFEAFDCVDNSFFSRKSKPSIYIFPKPVLLYVGQFIPRKGLKEFFKAAAIIMKTGCKFSILLVGDGSQKSELKHIAQELRLENVVFHPFVQQNELPAIYQSADVFIFPTLEDVWGLVVNEALVSGLPVLCSKYAGCARDLVPDIWQFDPLDIENSFVPALLMSIEKGLDARRYFMDNSDIKGSDFTANVIYKAISF